MTRTVRITVINAFGNKVTHIADPVKEYRALHKQYWAAHDGGEGMPCPCVSDDEAYNLWMEDNQRDEDVIKIEEL